MEGENKEGMTVITDAESAVKRKVEIFIPLYYKSTLNVASSVSAFNGASLYFMTSGHSNISPKGSSHLVLARVLYLDSEVFEHSLSGPNVHI